MKLSWYTIFWVTWVVSAIIVEAIAILNPHENDTLSEHCWHLMNSRPVWAWIICGFLIWLTVHLISRGRLG